MDEDLIFQMAREAESSNIRTVLDCKSNLKEEYIKEVKPYLIKFNKKAMDSYDERWDDISDLKTFASKYLDMGIKYVLIDLHEDGALLFNKNHYIYVDTKILEKNHMLTNEATDAFLAGFLTGLSKDYEEERMMKLAYSSELAVYTFGEIEKLNRKNIFDLRKNTKVRMHSDKSESKPKEE
ncbi:MAG: hypothetical protein MJ245_01415 [Clostridia bacterium]|nr:hypothetical protein [Clostridia bacterium]